MRIPFRLNQLPSSRSGGLQPRHIYSARTTTRRSTCFPSFNNPRSTCLTLESPSTALHLWRPSLSVVEGAVRTVRPSTSSSVAPQLFTAFMIGGLFFSILLPRIISWGAYLLQPLFRLPRLVKNRRINKQNKHRAGRIEFQTVRRQGLVVFQHIAEKLVQLSFQTQLRKGLLEGLSKVDNPNIQQIKLVSFQTCSAPQLHKGRIYKDIENAMIFDADMSWKNAMQGQLDINTKRLGLLVPVQVRNVQLEGTMRIVLTPLQEHPPGFGAILFSFTKTPRLDLDVDIAGKQITKVPWLKEGLIVAIQGILQNQMVWPNRIVNAALAPNFNVTLLEKDQLVGLETMDPFLKSETALLNERKGKSRRRIFQANNATKGTPSRKQPAPLKTLQSWWKAASAKRRQDAGQKNTTKDIPSRKQPAPLMALQSWWKGATAKRGQDAARHDNTKPTKDKTRKNEIWEQPSPAEKEHAQDEALDWNKLVGGILKPFDVEEEEVVSSSSTNTTLSNTTSPNNLESLQNALQDHANKTAENLLSVNSLDEFISLFGDV